MNWVHGSQYVGLISGQIENAEAKHFPFMCAAFKVDCWSIWKKFNWLKRPHILRLSVESWRSRMKIPDDRVPVTGTPSLIKNPNMNNSGRSRSTQCLVE